MRGGIVLAAEDNERFVTFLIERHRWKQSADISLFFPLVLPIISIIFHLSQVHHFYYQGDGMGYDPPEALGAIKEQVMAYAEMVAAKLGIDPDTSLMEVVARLGGKVVADSSVDFMGPKAGSLIVESKVDFTVKYSPYASPERIRFTIAHELGHFFLHYVNKKNCDGCMLAAREGSDRCEWEANWFAGALLMPREGFKSAFERFDGNLSTIASYFNVSESAAEVRAKVLGLSAR